MMGFGPFRPKAWIGLAWEAGCPDQSFGLGNLENCDDLLVLMPGSCRSARHHTWRFFEKDCQKGRRRERFLSMMNTLSTSMNMLNMSESEEASEYVCSEEESSQTDSFVEGLIEARMGVHEGEMAGPSVESGSEAYRKMQKKYKVLEASVDRVLALAHTPEVGSSNQTSPSESVGIAMVSASEGVEKVDFSGLRRQKKEVNLAMHRQEVPLVNVFLEGVKSDPEVLARTPATSYADRAQKTLLTQAYAYGEMYVNMAKADKEIQRLKRRNEMAKDKVAEAQEAIREKNTLVLQKAAMAKEMEELKRSRAEEVAAARVEAIESFRGSDELRNYIMDQMVAMQLGWEERVAMFNPSVEINFDTSGEPPSSSRTTDVVPEPEPEPAITDAPSTES
ncbi:unnamed protein product [Prunus armeniaca]